MANVISGVHTFRGSIGCSFLTSVSPLRGLTVKFLSFSIFVVLLLMSPQIQSVRRFGVCCQAERTTLLWLRRYLATSSLSILATNPFCFLNLRLLLHPQPYPSPKGYRTGYPSDHSGADIF